MDGWVEYVGQLEETRQNAELCSRPFHKAITKYEWAHNIRIKVSVAEVVSVVRIKPKQKMGPMPLLCGYDVKLCSMTDN
jgi:hypothetical protein